jgi:hypothetical protein
MDAQEQFEGFLCKYEPGVAAEAKKSLTNLRKLIRNAIEMVYDNYNALVVGFCPGMRPSEAILAIAVTPEWVSLCFLQGAELPDPEKRPAGEWERRTPHQDEKGCSDYRRTGCANADRGGVGSRESAYTRGRSGSLS